MFVRGGNVWPGRYLDGAGYSGYYWPSVGLNSNFAYDLYFDSGSVDSSGGDNRYLGSSVRCVALGG